MDCSRERPEDGGWAEEASRLRVVFYRGHRGGTPPLFTSYVSHPHTRPKFLQMKYTLGRATRTMSISLGRSWCEQFPSSCPTLSRSSLWPFRITFLRTVMVRSWSVHTRLGDTNSTYAQSGWRWMRCPPCTSGICHELDSILFPKSITLHSSMWLNTKSYCLDIYRMTWES